MQEYVSFRSYFSPLCLSFCLFQIVTIGCDRSVLYWNFSGELIGRSLSSSSSLFSICVSSQENPSIMAIGGNSSMIDIFINQQTEKTTSFTFT